MSLTEREEAIAQRAAEVAVQKLTEQLYADIGKSVIRKWFIWVGVAVVAFALGKGALVLPWLK